MTSINDLKWDPTDMFAVEQGFHSYMDRLMTEVLNGYPENGPTETLSGFPFCGCDTCVVREVIDAAWPYLYRLAHHPDTVAP